MTLQALLAGGFAAEECGPEIPGHTSGARTECTITALPRIARPYSIGVRQQGRAVLCSHCAGAATAFRSGGCAGTIPWACGAAGTGGAAGGGVADPASVEGWHQPGRNGHRADYETLSRSADAEGGAGEAGPCRGRAAAGGPGRGAPGQAAAVCCDADSKRRQTAAAAVTTRPPTLTPTLTPTPPRAAWVTRQRGLFLGRVHSRSAVVRCGAVRVCGALTHRCRVSSVCTSRVRWPPGSMSRPS